MIALTVKISDHQISSTLGRITAPATRQEALEAIGQSLVARAKDTIDQRGGGGPDGSWPRTGLSELYAGPRIWGDIKQRIEYQTTSEGVVISVGHVAGGVRQLGTVGAGGELPDIVPVAKKALTIPVSQAASIASYQGRDARSAFPDAFIPKRPKGSAGGGTGVNILVRKIASNKKNQKGERFEMLYVLVPRVAIRPHRYLPIDAEGNIAPPAVWEEIVALVDRVLLQPAGAKGGRMIINPIKDAMVALLKAHQADLKINTVAQDMALDNISEEIDTLVARFPAVIVCYYGRQAVREGTFLKLKLTYALVVATRSMQSANASDPVATDLLDPLLELFQGKTLEPSVQRDYFNLISETLQHKDKRMSIYQQLYETEAAVNFRAAMIPPA